MKELVISRFELEQLYVNNSSKDASKKLGVCIQTFYRMLDQAKIPRKRPGFTRGENVKITITD